MKTLPAVLLVASLVPALAGCGEGETCGPSRGVVERVVDGDTIVLAGGLKVRYLNVDTPEATTQVECFGPEAAEYNRSRVEGREVELTYDAECHDRYGRLLARVWVDGVDVGLDEVRNGYGCVLIIEPNVGARETFEEAEQVAQARGHGLWKECRTEGIPCGD